MGEDFGIHGRVREKDKEPHCSQIGGRIDAVGSEEVGGVVAGSLNGLLESGRHGNSGYERRTSFNWAVMGPTGGQ